MLIGRVDCFGCTLGRIGTSRTYEFGCLEQRWLVQPGAALPWSTPRELPAEHHGVRARTPSTPSIIHGWLMLAHRVVAM